MTTDRPFPEPPPQMRQRQRADGSWRVWWEPRADARAAGFKAAELDADRPGWSLREAQRLNAEVRRAFKAKRRAKSPRGRTVQDLVDAYQASPRYTLGRDQGGISDATRRSYAGVFRRIARKWGRTLVTDFDQQILIEWFESLSREVSPHTAKAAQRGFSVLFTYARRKGWRSDNPCQDLDLPTPAPRQRVASWADIDALLAEADRTDPAIACAVALGVFTGQRRKDILEARLGDFFEIEVEPDGTAWAAKLDAPEDWTEVMPGTALEAAIGTARAKGLIDATGGTIGLWLLVRSKRRNHGGMLLHPEVLPRVSDIARSARPGQTHLVTRKASALPFDGSAFTAALGAIRRDAAKVSPTLEGLQFRDLRRTFGTLARQGGASERDAADGLGNNAWKDPGLSGTYMPATFDTASSAVAAIRRPAKPRARTRGTGR